MEPARALRPADARSARAADARNTRTPEPRGAQASESEAPAPDHERPSAYPSASASSPTLDVQLPPGMNDEFDEDLLLDIDAALSAVDENAFSMLFKKVTELVDNQLVRKEKFAHPDNCLRWRSLRTRGYAPKSALAKQINAGALVRCGSLEFLARAQPSRVSHVRSVLVGSGPGTLPAIVASATSPLAREARDRAVAKGSSLAELIPSARIIPSDLPGRLSIAEPNSDSIITINAEVWGDINADGVEDLLLSVLNTAVDNSSFEMRLLHVTRRSSSSPLTVIAVAE